ncbi:uncharacterized protein [Cicer arietinum]|uniref:Uncharacterized protein LOC101513425 n=1 Tax=Cicer arietinum TaxID=3827 RepID=A0A3Q7YGI5_CICAR|nr:uncharacterized protein LOC101513425 [Cicer arietinum]
MDSKSPSKKESTDQVARESLIAISNTSPDKILDSNSVSESKKSDGGVLPNCDQDEQFRSELISISYSESPDVKIGSISMGV